MRPAIRIAFLGLVIAAVIGAPVSAGGRRHPPAPRIDAQAAAGSARQGGTLLVVARVRLPRGFVARNGEPAASAVVHFGSGDVAVDLTGRLRDLRGHRFRGRAWWAPARVWRGVARVGVSADEQVGWVPVDVTITLGDGSVTLATYARIRPARRGQTPKPSPDPTPAPCTDGCQEL